MRASLIGGALALVLLSGCGADVAGAAATTATLQAQQARQAQAQAAQIQKNLDSALQAGQQATASAADQ